MQAGGNMEAVKSRLRAVVAKQGRRVARIVGVDEEIRRLHERVAVLEREVQEARQLNQRMAELTDVVAEVLVPAADRDDKVLAEKLATYNRESF
jgi:antitoxin (DNA-binding transcriptional repressor) of toxin-antitoxin stability system